MEAWQPANGMSLVLHYYCVLHMPGAPLLRFHNRLLCVAGQVSCSRSQCASVSLVPFVHND